MTQTLEFIKGIQEKPTEPALLRREIESAIEKNEIRTYELTKPPYIHAKFATEQEAKQWLELDALYTNTQEILQNELSEPSDIINAILEYKLQCSTYENQQYQKSLGIFREKIGLQELTNDEVVEYLEMYITKAFLETPPKKGDKRYTEPQVAVLQDQFEKLTVDKEKITESIGNALFNIRHNFEVNKEDLQTLRTVIVDYSIRRNRYNTELETDEELKSTGELLFMNMLHEVGEEAAENGASFKAIHKQAVKLPGLKQIDAVANRALQKGLEQARDILLKRGVPVPKIESVLKLLAKNPIYKEFLGNIISIESPVTVGIFLLYIHGSNNKVKAAMSFASFMAQSGASNYALFNARRVILSYQKTLPIGSKLRAKWLRGLPKNPAVQIGAATLIMMGLGEQVDKYIISPAVEGISDAGTIGDFKMAAENVLQMSDDLTIGLAGDALEWAGVGQNFGSYGVDASRDQITYLMEQQRQTESDTFKNTVDTWNEKLQRDAEHMKENGNPVRARLAEAEIIHDRETRFILIEKDTEAETEAFKQEVIDGLLDDESYMGDREIDGKQYVEISVSGRSKFLKRIIARDIYPKVQQVKKLEEQLKKDMVLTGVCSPSNMPEFHMLETALASTDNWEDIVGKSDYRIKRNDRAIEALIDTKGTAGYMLRENAAKFAEGEHMHDLWKEYLGLCKSISREVTMLRHIGVPYEREKLGDMETMNDYIQDGFTENIRHEYKRDEAIQAQDRSATEAHSLATNIKIEDDMTVGGFVEEASKPIAGVVKEVGKRIPVEVKGEAFTKIGGDLADIGIGALNRIPFVTEKGSLNQLGEDFSNIGQGIVNRIPLISGDGAFNQLKEDFSNMAEGLEARIPLTSSETGKNQISEDIDNLKDGIAERTPFLSETGAWEQWTKDFRNFQNGLPVGSEEFGDHRYNERNSLSSLAQGASQMLSVEEQKYVEQEVRKQVLQNDLATFEDIHTVKSAMMEKIAPLVEGSASVSQAPATLYEQTGIPKHIPVYIATSGVFPQEELVQRLVDQFKSYIAKETDDSYTRSRMSIQPNNASVFVFHCAHMPSGTCLMTLHSLNTNSPDSSEWSVDTYQAEKHNTLKGTNSTSGNTHENIPYDEWRQVHGALVERGANKTPTTLGTKLEEIPALRTQTKIATENKAVQREKSKQSQLEKAVQSTDQWVEVDGIFTIKYGNRLLQFTRDTGQVMSRGHEWSGTATFVPEHKDRVIFDDVNGKNEPLWIQNLNAFLDPAVKESTKEMFHHLLTTPFIAQNAEDQITADTESLKKLVELASKDVYKPGGMAELFGYEWENYGIDLVNELLPMYSSRRSAAEKRVFLVDLKSKLLKHGAKKIKGKTEIVISKEVKNKIVSEFQQSHWGRRRAG